jgi:hypothetical protein
VFDLLWEVQCAQALKPTLAAAAAADTTPAHAAAAAAGGFSISCA